MEAAVQGIKEAKEARAKKDMMIAAKAKTQSKKKKDTSAEYLARFFRKASVNSIKMGKARLTLEDAVKRAERILLEKKRFQMAAAASVEDEAEMLAQELFHTPGSLLTKDELAHIYSELPNCLDRREEIDCDLVPFVETFRTADGTCNNLEQSTLGASFTPLGRTLPAHYEDGLQQPHGFRQTKKTDKHIFRNGPFTPPYPSARLISSTIVRDRLENETQLTHLVMQWGQFLDHDLDLIVEVDPDEAQCDIVNCTCTDVCFPVRVPDDDEAFGEDEPRAGNCLPFARSIPACEIRDFTARDQINELTHYIDGSMIYGSTIDRADFLREFKGGLLKVGPVFPTGGRPSLPEVSATPPCLPSEPFLAELPPSERCCPEGRESCFIAGDIRVNEQVSLTVMHTIWVREHNRVATELAALNPQWDDERIYQEARKIVIAQVQQVTFEEFLPALFGRRFFRRLIGKYLGYQPARKPVVPTAFATAAFRFGHSLIQDAFERLDGDFNSISVGPLNLRDSFMNPQAYFDSEGTDPIVRGWITQPARAVDEFLNSILTTQLFETEEGFGMDLATLNLQRSRDHGLPPYPAWKQFCQNRFGDALPKRLFQFSNELTKIRFLQTYGALDTVDLWVGGLAEEAIPGGVIGPTFACIFAITFSDIRLGDRFWYESNIFTPEQLTQIQKTSLARVLCDNADALSTIQSNPFFAGNRQMCLLGIPGIDFTPWIEDPLCYQRVRIEPHTLDLKLHFSSVLSENDTRDYPLVRSGPTTSKFEQCIPFECPTHLRNTPIANFPSTLPDLTNFLTCRAVVNPGLPPSTASPDAESVYFAIWNRNTVQASSGLHKHLGSCQRSSVIAMTFFCPPSSPSATKSDVELEHELAQILQTGIASTGGNNDNYNTSLTVLERVNVTNGAREIPEVVMKIITGTSSVS